MHSSLMIQEWSILFKNCCALFIFRPLTIVNKWIQCVKIYSKLLTVWKQN